MTTRFTHLDIGRSPGGLRPSTLISLGRTFSIGISCASGARNGGSTWGMGAPTEIGGVTCTCGAAGGGRIVRQRRRLFGMRVQQRFDRKDVVRIGVFQCWRGLHWRSLAQSNVTRIGRRACFAAWKTLCPESLVQAATRPARFDQSKAISWRGWGHGFRVLEPARRKREGNKGFSGSGAERAGRGRRVLERQRLRRQRDAWRAISGRGRACNAARDDRGRGRARSGGGSAPRSHRGGGAAA